MESQISNFTNVGCNDQKSLPDGGDVRSRRNRRQKASVAYDRVVNFHALAKPLHARYSDQGRREIGTERGLRMLILQFVEDRSDREMERFMRDNMAARWFSVSARPRERPTIPTSSRSASVSEPSA